VYYIYLHILVSLNFLFLGVPLRIGNDDVGEIALPNFKFMNSLALFGEFHVYE
jgi:hypothetical protein